MIYTLLYIYKQIIVFNINPFFRLPFSIELLGNNYSVFYFKKYLKTANKYLKNVYTILTLLIYVLLLFLIFSTLRSTVPRLRLDQLLDFFWKYFIFFGFIVIFIGVLY